MQPLTWARTSLFEGLDRTALEDVLGRMQARRFAAREVICREDEPGDSLFVIQAGLAHVIQGVGQPGGGRSIARLRRGEIVGELSLITGEARSATVIANVPTEVLELRRDAFAAMLARHPATLVNLNRILAQRLVARSHPRAQGRRGEAVALVTGTAGGALKAAAAIVEAAQAASPRPVAVLDFAEALAPRSLSEGEQTAESVLAGLDDLLATHGTVILVIGAGHSDVPLLLEHMDRVVLLATEDEAEHRARLFQSTAERTEIALLPVGQDLDPPPEPRSQRAKEGISGLRVIRAIDSKVPNADTAWLGRHLTRTKLGLALGAGGAKGYAHIGALQVLEEAGYTVDFVAGSSIGAMVGAWLGLQRKASDVEAVMRAAFSPENVAAMFKLSMTGMSSGLEVHTRVCRETTQERAFADLPIPLVAMAVDLTTRQPVPIRDGLLWQALLASTALAGMFPPYLRGEQRLVDGLALVPVPTGAVIDAGADISLSVNLMSREVLPAWPGQAAPPPPPARAGSRMLETLLEVMDLSQLDSSVRHAALAHVVVSPRFGPGTWRDFHLADLFLNAGRLASQEQLPALRALARPQAG
jgi:predicted acylesterase/phospholipase RssA/CRP-like cAMP-binding protein